MSHDYQPRLHPVAIRDLRPTQITVGLREVQRKRRDWHRRAETDGRDFLGRHMVPAVIGPKGRAWIVDHHHLVRALHEEGVEHVLVSVIADLGALKKSEFLVFMDNRNWLHPFDETGTRRPLAALPKSVDGLVDDPWRSLAGELRAAGGCAKDTTPYAEFLWADFLRRRLGRNAATADPETLLARALDLARGAEARHLPGWAGADAG